MGILNIRPATREGAHLLVQVFGGPRSGKTRTALRLARGIAGADGKIGVLDTEAGRARFYSDKIDGGFFVGDLTPPFTPKRYRDAIEEFVTFGADVLVIDSFSHVWQGPGGVLEAADQAEANGKKGLQKWLAPKVEYRKLITFLLSTNIHIIFCSRAKQPVAEGKDDRGNKTMVTLPWEPIQDRTLKYEMTIVLPMTLDGGYEVDPTRLKAPDDLARLFTGELLTEETGAMIARWVAGGEPVNHAHELLRKHANDAAQDGSDAFRAFWKGISADQRNALRPSLANLQSITEEAGAAQERARETARENAERTDANLDDPFGGKAIEHVGGQPPSQPAAPSPRPDAGRSGDDAERLAGEPLCAGNAAASRPGDDEDAFGLPPLAHSEYGPAGATYDAPDYPAPNVFSAGSSQPPEEKGKANDVPARGREPNPPAGETDTPAAGRTTEPSADLLEGHPENVTVPFPRNPAAKDLDYFARQLLALIAEKPPALLRLAAIRGANENGIRALKSGTVELYDEVQAALARRT